MTNYLEAPATALVATRCACCSKPLVDAVSVECGMGPKCRKMHSFGVAQGAANWGLVRRTLADLPGIVPADLVECEDWAHAVANKLVYSIAAEQKGANVGKYTEALAALGFVALAKRIAHRLGCLEIQVEGDALRLTLADEQATPEAVKELRYVPGRRYDPATKSNTFPLSARKEVWGALKRLFPKGTLVVGLSVAAL